MDQTCDKRELRWINKFELPIIIIRPFDSTVLHPLNSVPEPRFLCLCSCVMFNSVCIVWCALACLCVCLYACMLGYVACMVCMCCTVYHYILSFICVHLCLYPCVYAFCTKVFSSAGLRRFTDSLVVSRAPGRSPLHVRSLVCPFPFLLFIGSHDL